MALAHKGKEGTDNTGMGQERHLKATRLCRPNTGSEGTEGTEWREAADTRVIYERREPFVLSPLFVTLEHY